MPRHGSNYPPELRERAVRMVADGPGPISVGVGGS